jgi:hypothetical protein
VAQTCISFITSHESGVWCGSAKTLHGLLSAAEPETVKAKELPKTARVLAGELRRVAPELRTRGIDVRFDRRERNERPIRITRRGAINQ